MLVKLGLAPRLQLELQTSAVRPPGTRTTGIGDFSIGLKWRIVEAAPIVADFAILPSIKVPSGSAGPEYHYGTTDVNLLFISSRKGRLRLYRPQLRLHTRRSGDVRWLPRDQSVWTFRWQARLRGLGWAAELCSIPQRPARPALTRSLPSSWDPRLQLASGLSSTLA